MPALSSICRIFPKITPQLLDSVIDKFLSFKHRDPNTIYNQIYNRLLYPTSIPIETSDTDFDWMLLGEAIKLEPGKYYDRNFKRIFVPEKMLVEFNNLDKLVSVFLDLFTAFGLTTILLKTENVGTKNLGTYIKPRIQSKVGIINIWVNKKRYQIKLGNFSKIPVAEHLVDVRFSCPVATLLGKHEFTMEVAGGQFGLAIDARL